MLFTEEVRREVSVGGAHQTTMLIASDAQADTAPTGGFVALVDGALDGAFCHFSSILETWGQVRGQPVTCIAVCECSMVITTLWDLRARVRGRRILWLLDNSASLHALVKGTSTNQFLSRAVELFHMFCFWFQVDVWFEFVDSESNFSDGISRELQNDPFCSQLGIKPHECIVRTWMWEDPLHQVWASFRRAALGLNS